MDNIKYLEMLNEYVTGCFLFPLVVILGLFFTFSLRGFQVTKIKRAFQNLLAKNEAGEGNISHFEAISTVLAGNFGTGNISGMAIAIATGGPGALVWMWIMAFLASSIQYASCVLGVQYRQVNEEGEFVGGPMYYLSKGLNFPLLAKVFCLLTLFAAITVGNLVQINSITLPLHSVGMNPLLFSIILAVVLALVLIGGIKRIAKAASVIVPLMAFIYVAFALIVILNNYQNIIPAFKLMFISAFDFQAMAGGFLGAGSLKMITTGFNRSIFATDAGTGIVPILQGGARTSHPVNDGLVTLVAPLMVMIVCTMTGLVLLTTGAWTLDLQSTNLISYSFSLGLGHKIGEYVVIISLILFGFTTVLAWSYCAEKAIAYLVGNQWARWFNYLYIALVPVGTLVRVELVWVLADICITLMLLVNMVGIIGLSRYVIDESRSYFGSDLLLDPN